MSIGQELKVIIDGLEMNYKIAGEGELFLILHGWGSNSEKWQKVGELLIKERYKLIIPDLPGFGKSDNPQNPWHLDDYCNFLEKFIHFLNLEKFSLLGHSFGGALAIKLVLKFPEKIEKLFLVNAACLRRKNFKKRLFFALAKIFKIFSFLPFYPFFRKVFYNFFVGKSDYPYTEGVMKETYLKIIKEDLSNLLNKIQIPTFIIWGEKDTIKNIKEAYLIHQKIKNSKLKIIPQVGHSPHLEAPEKLTEIISNFIKKYD